ncbi:MAG: AbrB/MazE/SpoVT family DNA-binding domain-containing protein [Methermicoccaceae archaeon]
MTEKIEPASIVAKVKIHSGGRIVVPSELRKEWGVKDGDHLVLYYTPLGNVAIAPAKPIKREIRTPRII